DGAVALQHARLLGLRVVGRHVAQHTVQIVVGLDEVVHRRLRAAVVAGDGHADCFLGLIQQIERDAVDGVGNGVGRLADGDAVDGEFGVPGLYGLREIRRTVAARVVSQCGQAGAAVVAHADAHGVGEPRILRGQYQPVADAVV